MELIPQWGQLVLNVSTLVFLIAALDTLHSLRRDLARLRRQQDAPMVAEQDRPRVEVVA